jgi:DNA-binding NarL/FixJ family response regulator
MTTSELPGTGHVEAGVGSGPTRRVVIVDDHELLRAGTRRILEEAAGFEVVGEADDGDAALAVVGRLVPDVVLVDIRLPSMNGIEVARRIVADHPGMTVLILSAYDDEDYVRAALAAGVSGFLLKTTPSQELIRAITSACGGTTVLDKAVSARLLGAAPAAVRGSSPLTAREREVVRLAARGLANKAIGQRLGISPRTVEGHLNHVFEKLGTTSRTELVHFALTNGLLLDEDTPAGDALP